MVLLDGRRLAQKIQDQLLIDFQKLNLPHPPKLLIIQVGDDPASNKFVSLKQKMGEKLGITVEVKKFSFDVSSSEILATIQYSNQHPHLTGLMVQLPLPPSFNTTEILANIHPRKDVDGLNPKSGILPATVVGILRLLAEYQIPLSQKKVCLINNTPLIGLPLSAELLKLGAEVSVCHEHTANIKEISSTSDILISATGVSNLIDQSWVKPGSVVIDVGFPGDVNQAGVAPTAGFLTPNPGGVGPMTVVSLFQNLYFLAKNRYSTRTHNSPSPR